MLLGDLIARFADPMTVDEALAALGDLALVTRLTVRADEAGLSTGAFAAACVASYADTASDDEWTTLMGQMGRAEDPGLVLMRRALDAGCSHGAGGCTCGGAH